MRRVAVTGVGAVTPLGTGVAATWDGVVAGRVAIGPITRFDASGFPVRFAAEVPSVPGEGEGDLKLRLTHVAAIEALRQSGIAGGPRVGVCVGSEAARPPLDEVARRMLRGEAPDRDELAHMAPDAPTALVAALAGAEGPRSTIATACTSSAQAVGEALLRIRRGEVDAMIAGGVDILVDPLMVTGFSLLGALSTRNDDPQTASRPFDRDRDGFVLGEGAGFLVLEEWEHAKRRGAVILAELAGYGCSCNAWRITDSPPDGRGAAQAMLQALADARRSAEDVDYVNAHGTSTPMNDVSEARGIRTALGVHAASVPVSSTKSMMGHLVAACGAVEAILCVQAVARGVIPPNPTLQELDPDCALNVPVRAEDRPVHLALTNAFGFGGSNATLAVARADV